ncbi:MAG: MFS transporter [Candidatus Omnitrophica bacterium]|nr:MFS transporter [Candidatus Omnitrophota bacterium]
MVSTSNSSISRNDLLLFWGCFIALIATAFGFVIRTQIIGDWGLQFALTETQKGELLGVGLWPFAISIVLGSLIIDKVGYGRCMIFAFICHVASVLITINAHSYWGLYIGTFIVALGNGTVEAVINPVVATMFPKDKTKWLIILHAGWPGGLILGGLLAIGMGGAAWSLKVALIMIPTLIYAFLLWGRQFPVHERVVAKIPYKAMLQEVGILGALIIVALMVRELGRVFEWSSLMQVIVGGGLVIGYGLYVRTWGRPMFIFLLLVMILSAITELGTDSWITPLMQNQMQVLGLHPGLVLVFTALIMAVLRIWGGRIVHVLQPLGLLFVSAFLAAVGLFALSKTTGMGIIMATTTYAVGTTFLWPTTLGLVSERFPKGGALTMNSIAGVGMLSVGIVGTAFLGNVQDKTMDTKLYQHHQALYAQVIGPERTSIFGPYRALDLKKISLMSPKDKQEIEKLTEQVKKEALAKVALLPLLMMVCYGGLWIYFRSKGGYRSVELTE